MLFIHLVNKNQRQLQSLDGSEKKETDYLIDSGERERPFPPLRGFESHYSSIINAECFVINKLPLFIVRSLPCWINFSIYLSPISIFFSHSQSNLLMVYTLETAIWCLWWPPTAISGRKTITLFQACHRSS